MTTFKLVFLVSILFNISFSWVDSLDFNSCELTSNIIVRDLSLKGPVEVTSKLNVSCGKKGFSFNLRELNRREISNNEKFEMNLLKTDSSFVIWIKSGFKEFPYAELLDTLNLSQRENSQYIKFREYLIGQIVKMKEIFSKKLGSDEITLLISDEMTVSDLIFFAKNLNEKGFKRIMLKNQVTYSKNNRSKIKIIDLMNQDILECKNHSYKLRYRCIDAQYLRLPTK